MPPTVHMLAVLAGIFAASVVSGISGLAFPLIADNDRKVSAAYGVARRILPIAKRVTFVIDPDGKVAARFEHELQVNKHLDNVLRFLRTAKTTP